MCQPGQVVHVNAAVTIEVGRVAEVIVACAASGVPLLTEALEVVQVDGPIKVGVAALAVDFLDLEKVEGAVIDTEVVDKAFPEKVERLVGADAEGGGLCFGCDRA